VEFYEWNEVEWSGVRKKSSFSYVINFTCQRRSSTGRFLGTNASPLWEGFEPLKICKRDTTGILYIKGELF